ncbi:SusC/RagA family TonB-linked outer membrane protein [Desertivirga xinjiangensis]|uniref:SusC/RagA family TonB-linked outer membrane protein n=1 Tax=Desertivirga xinjiangensis TaxID=539206 RepID=UPI00210EE10D|nr:TonB-dependent receptor [Pedobacter xinjiangensis]
MRKIFIFFLFIAHYSTLFAQQTKQVSGVVTDAKYGDPLVGVSVSVKGKTLGAVTDVNGKYSIKVPVDGAPVLIFRYIGFLSEEILVGGKTTINLKLREDSKTLSEVVVIGYGEVQRKDLTGSVASVKMEDLQKAPVGSAIDALAGRVAGVQVSSESGKPGAGVNIVIRGANSLTQDNSPLYVIDGFPMEDANASILNPAEIESMEVLKDASATAIYGARGANGVIIITTKRGKEGAPTITYNAYGGFQQVINKIDLMGPYEFVKLQAERDPTGVKTSYLRGDTTLDFYRTAGGTDWQDRLFRTASMQNHSLSVSGGTKSTKYSLSGNIFDQQGAVINSGFNRKQGKFTLDQTVNDKFKLGSTVIYTGAKTHGANPATPDQNHSAMNYLMYSVWGYRPVSSSGADLEQFLNDPDLTANEARNDYRINPILSANNELRHNFENRLVANGFAEYAFTKSLKLKISGGVNNATYRSETFNNSKTRYGYSGSTDRVNGGILYTDNNTWRNENLLTYAKKVKKHTITAVGGLEFQENSYKRYGLRATQLPNEILGLAGLSQGESQPVTSVNSEWSLMSYLGRVNYNYSYKYYLTASFRADGSSKFRKGNHWGYFPSASLAWRINNEEFMKEYRFVSDAKLRMGYGVTGNNRVSEYATYAQMNFDNTSNIYNGYYSFNNNLIQGVFLSSIANPDLKWESTSQTNIGLDLGFFKQRVTFTADYYKKITSDLLLDALLPYSTGYTSAYKNIGKTSNEGLELSFTTENIRKADFSWTSSFNIAFNKNKILELTQNQESIVRTVQWDQNFRELPGYIAKIGQPLGQIYGYIWDGVYQYSDFDLLPSGAYQLKDNIATNGNSQTFIKPGDIKYRDLNGDGTVNDLDRTVIGRGYPIHQGGFTNNFRYKNLDLNVFFQWSYGNDVLNANRLLFEAGNKSNLNQYSSFENRWTPENTNTTMFRVGGEGPNAYSSRIVEDASYLRLKTVDLGYRLPKSVLDHVKVKSARVYVSAQNLFTITDYTGYDPEVAVYYSPLTPGFDYSSYPRPKTIVFGLNVSL